MLTFEQIKELIDLVAERELGAVEVERSGFRLLIEGRRPPEATPAQPPAAAGPAPSPQPPAGDGNQGEDEGEAGAEADDEGELPEGTHVLQSPIVGTFYRAASPDADPFVEVGDTVQQGQVLCIVEAMKLMNEIEADADGVVLCIFPDNEQPVEFGQPLFAIEPS